MPARIRKEDKERLYQCFQRGGDYIALSKDLNINTKSARTIVRRAIERDGVVEGQRGGAYNRKVDDEMKRKIEEIVDNNNLLTIAQINSALREALPNKPHIEKSCLAATMDGMLYSVKSLTTIPEQRNSDRVKGQRKTYADWFLQEAVLVPNLVFLDECGFNLWTCRTRGRSRIGLPATRVVAGQRGQNTTLLLAVSCTRGINLHKFYDGSVTRERFQEFMDNLSDSLPQNERALVILDNARCHSNITLTNRLHEMKFLPPYSPQLNPIEMCFSSWKAHVKRQLNSPSNQERIGDRSSAASAGMSLQLWRANILKEIGQESLSSVTSQLVLNCYQHIFPFLLKGQREEDF